MAPTKNSQSNCKDSENHVANSDNISVTNDFSGNQNVVVAGAATAQKKQTGTVPKATAPVQRMEHRAVAQQIRSSAPHNVATTPTTVAGSKSAKSTTKRSAASLMQQQKQQQMQQPLAHNVFGTERAGLFNIVTATQQQPQHHPHEPQQQSQQQQHTQQHQRKNTEIVAPIRRELKDLNDYLLSAVVTTTNSSQQQQQLHAPQQHQLKQHNYSKTQHQQQQQTNESTSATSASFDIESIPDSQSRFCYPVRPIPRRNLQQSDTNIDYNNGNFSVANSTSAVGTTTSLNQLNHPAAVGVVIPTTPAILNNCNNNNNSNTFNAINEENTATSNHITAETTIRSNPCNNNNSTINQQQLFLLQQLQHQIEEQSSLLVAASQQQQQHSTPNFIDLSASNLPTTVASRYSSDIVSNDVNFLQRLQLIQQILAISSKPSSVPVAGVQTGSSQQQYKTKNMVNENRSPTTTDRDIIVNSTSLEDVAINEMNDNRAQSIQSLHSAHEETPTPDNTPSYDELQQRLETSNRNIQNMQDQQQQLLRLQQQAKQHLTEMEALRNQAAPLSFGQQNGGNLNDPPEYQSIEQVHSDMSALVGRMKNLTTFIQHQNELGNLLGDDGPDILAEQEALQRKLESLRVQRDEMRSLVGELQDINRSAERTAEQRRQENAQKPHQEDKNLYAHINSVPVATSTATTQRVGPVEYSRIVPIELLQAATGELPAAHTAEDPAAAEMIRQKVADIAAMKAQLKRLKDMMETVNIIEEHTARKDPKDIGREAAAADAVSIPVQRQHERPISYDRERTPTAGVENNELMSAKVRMLNEVTSDLRAQALNLQAERDRIKALKEEIVRRKAEAAVAAQLGEDALKRNSRTPTPQIQQRAEREQSERDVLKEEYEVKKKEFEQLCQRLQQNDGCDTSTPTTTLHRRANGTQEIASEADDEADVEEELANDSDFGTTATGASKYFSSSQTEQKNSATNATVATPQRASKHSTEDSAAAAAVSNITQDTAASLEAASMQSGSSQSYSMPPPMHHLNGASASSWLPGPIPPPLPTSWNPHFYYGGSSVPPSFTPPHFSTLHSGIGSIHQHNHQPAPSSTDCVCSATNSASTFGAAMATATGATSAASGGTAAPLTADPMLLQQFVQTQQMLINSVCQCNQMLWHQQREIDALNNTIHVLQDRLLTLAGPSNADLAFNIRAESVPPPTSLSNTLHSNNIYASLQNRAQSEQPTAFLPPVRGGSTYAASNFHQQQQQQQHLYQQQRQQRSAAGYNYATDLQQQNASSTSTMFTALNNTAPPPPPQFNNEAPQSPMATAGPGPIFMHHHNNTIHQNNANLRTQNHHANNLQQQQQQNNVGVNCNNTLNNQVPPGNRANNYWDNFRSYSRQNLLSTNSTKSNEDQNQQHVHQQIEPQYQATAPHILPLPELPQEPQQLQQLFQQRLINQTTTNDCINLNFDSNNSNSNNNNANYNKYMRSLQRSRINQLQQQQQQLVASNMLSTSTSNASNIYQANVPTASARELLESLTWHDNLAVGNDENIFSNYNLSANNDMSATYASNAANARNMNTNMNLNFGNNMLQYQRNKVPAKATCRGAILQRGNTAQHQQYHNSIEPQRYDMLPATTTAAASIAATTSSNPLNRSRERAQDFLLCTVDMASAYNYMPTAPVAEDFLVENNAVPVNEEDDTTSEEIKRNLLVNALKNDKFTTKFYESIKEDVFRRLESLLLEKEAVSAEPPMSTSIVQQHQQEQNVTQIVNEVSGAVALYPTRKLFLNAQMGNRQQQLEPQPISQQVKLEVVPATKTEYDSNNIEETESNNADDNDLSSTSQPLISIAESMGGEAASVSLEDEEPEENENQNRNRTTTGDRAATIAIQNICSTNTQVTATTDNRTPVIAEQVRPLTSDQNSTTSKKRKNQRQLRSIEVTLGSSSGTLQSEERKLSETPNINNNIRHASDTPNQNLPDFELINYIITRIHNQTHANTIINDTLLVEIAKLTATAAHNLTVAKLADIACGTSGGSSNNLATMQQQHPPNISPKKIYAKIKKLSIPRQRDQFLIWYQGYLETLFIINNNINSNTNKHVSSEKKLSARNNKQVQQVSTECKLDNNNTNSKSQLKLQNDTSKTTSKSNTNNNNILLNVDNLDMNDADLAEADQICSANTSSNTSNTLPQHIDKDNDNDVDHDIDVVVNNYVANHAKNVAIAAGEIHTEELENNENPEEEGAAACNAIQEKYDVEKGEKVKKAENHSIKELQTSAATDFFIPLAASLNASSNSDNTEDDSSNNTARAIAPKTEILKRNSVA